MSQSWDSVASMHDHLLTVHRSCTNSILAWARLSIGTVRMRRWKRLQRPHPLAKQASVLWQRSRSARTLLPTTDRPMNRPRLSLRSRLGG